MARLEFIGKAFVQNYHLQVKYHQLIPRKEKSLPDKVSLHDNLIIHGDNLKVLKALLPTYAGKIKCIYIDPPYNTGNENWVYNDNVNSPRMQDWLGKIVDKEDLTRHDKWLCMMTPRLKLLRELLTDDGLIFISIDDNENHRLRMLLDDVFGEDNFVSHIARQTIRGGTGPSDAIRKTHDYVLVYAKYKEEADVGGQEIESIPLDMEDEKGKYRKGRELNKWGAGSRREDSPTMWFPIPGPKGKEVYPIRNDGTEGRWRWGKKKMLKAVADNEVIFEKRDNGTYIVYEKVRSENPRGKSFESLFLQDFTNAAGTERLKELFEGKSPLDYPKPISLIERICEIARVEDGDIVLDSFAGSGTTADAVMCMNAESEVACRFILIQLPETIDKKQPAYKMGFREVVEITAERVRRVIKGVKSAKDENLKKGLGGTFSYFELGEPIEMESILSGDNLPNYKELARYVFYTATGEEFDEKAIDEKRNFIGESREYLVYLFYKPDIDYLKAIALTLDKAQALGSYKNKKRLVFAPTKYLDQDHLDSLRIDFAQLPFEIYKLVK
ncbi:MAG: DNA methylase [Planctomycetes bacterium RBG_13_46_10]|nr:MAG: DNA methylase [Planctomycetes bacterium RBG_13_46_10]